MNSYMELLLLIRLCLLLSYLKEYIYMHTVTNLGVVLDPLGCRTLYLSERNWKIGVRGPLYVCTSRCVLFKLTYFQETGRTSSHTTFYKPQRGKIRSNDGLFTFDTICNAGSVL